MRGSFRLAQILNKHVNGYGFCNKFAKKHKLDRHWLRHALHNRAKSYKMESLEKISDALIKHYAEDLAEHGIQPSDLPGALFVQTPTKFWNLFSSAESLEFGLGRRIDDKANRTSHVSGFVSATDARLWAKLLHLISDRNRRADLKAVELTSDGDSETDIEATAAELAALAEAETQAENESDRAQHFPPAHFALAPKPISAEKFSDPKHKQHWYNARCEARRLYKKQNRQSQKFLTLELGTIKVNPTQEYIFANCFPSKPFAADHPGKNASNRRCPIFFRYRKSDPQPPSCCGGMKLYDGHNEAAGGIYLDTDEDEWEFFPSNENEDAAFVFYVIHRSLARVELAMGGYSSRATKWLFDRFEDIAEELWPPQFQSKQKDVGLFVIRFKNLVPADAENTGASASAEEADAATEKPEAGAQNADEKTTEQDAETIVEDDDLDERFYNEDDDDDAEEEEEIEAKLKVDYEVVPVGREALRRRLERLMPFELVPSTRPDLKLEQTDE